MKTTLSLVAILALALALASAARAEAPDHAEEGRAIVAAFGGELRAALQAALGEGGPLAAIAVCEEQAPRIAQAAAERSGAEVMRTSLKVRNPANRPDDQQRAVLEALAVKVAANPDGPPPERLEVLADGRVRFMSAIVTQAPCLACHGDSLADDVADAIEARYPDDQARGYRVGQLRGAFSITWPAQ